MKLSIKNIFKNITIFMSFALIVATISVLFTFEQGNSFKKIDILNTQKVIILELYKLDKEDLELALIKFNGKSTELQYTIEKLYNLYMYDFVGKYVLDNTEEYLNQLDTLTTLVNTFNTSALNHYNSLTTTEETKSYKLLNNSFVNLNNHIGTIIFNNISYDYRKFELLQIMAIFSFLVVLLFTFWYKNRLIQIYEDITFLYSPKRSDTNHELYTKEADAIYLRMNKRSESKIDPTKIDPITGIYNNKGLESSYAEKKGLRDSYFTAVAILEIDNFSKTNRTLPQDFTQSILKKIAYTISLYEQTSDVIARSDYNQFTIVLSRETKEQAFKEIDAIRQSISELKFVAQTKVAIQITTSGGFIIKPNNLAFNIAIDEAKIILEFAKTQSKNKIYQKRDMISA